MKEIYQWTEWFSELAQKVNEGGKDFLHGKVFNEIDWGEKTQSIKEYEVTDPFSFFCFLAFKSGNTDREVVYNSVHNLFQITVKLPENKRKNKNEYYNFPKNKSGQNTIFTDGELVGENIEELKKQAQLYWKLFNQAVAGKLEAEDFKNVLSIKNAGVTNLTRTLFLINPTVFYPIDKTGSLALADACGLLNFKEAEKQIQEQGLEVYLKIQQQIKAKFEGCEFYEINQLAYLIQGNLKISNNYWQVSTNAEDDGIDRWEKEFEPNYWVRAYKDRYPTKQVKRGDIILVRTGTTSAKAIGIVYRDGNRLYKKTYSIVDVLWVTKPKENSQTIEGVNGQPVGFSDAGNNSIETAFRNKYPETFEILESLVNGNLH